MEKSLFKMGSLKKNPSISYMALISVSAALEEKWSRIAKLAKSKEDRGYVTVERSDMGEVTKVHIRNTTITPTGLVIMVDDEKVKDDLYLRSILREVLSDIFSISPPSSKYLSLRFREIMGKEFKSL